MAVEKKLLEGIALMNQGKEEGFNILYSHTYNYVYSRAKYIMKDEQDALDLTQETFIQAYKGISGLEDANNVYAWLGSIVYRQGMRIFRKKREILVDEDAENIFTDIVNEDKDFCPEETAETKATAEIVMGFVNELPELQRSAILAFYYDNMKLEDIAKAFDCSVNTIKSRLNYAKKYLKTMVEEDEKKNRYKLHSFSPAILLLAFKYLFAKEEYLLTAAAAQGVYDGSCYAVGLIPTAISAGNAAAATVSASASEGSGAAGSSAAGEGSTAAGSSVAGEGSGAAAGSSAAGEGSGAAAGSSAASEGSSAAAGSSAAGEGSGAAGSTAAGEGSGAAAGSSAASEGSGAAAGSSTAGSPAAAKAAAAAGKAGLGAGAKAGILLAAAVVIGGAAILGTRNSGDVVETETVQEEIIETSEQEIIESETALAESEAEAEETETEEDEYANLPEDREWVDDLYTMLITDDYEGVLAVLQSEDLLEKAAPYEYEKFSVRETEIGYKLITTDMKAVGIVAYITTDGDIRACSAFYSENEDADYGFEYTGPGDHQVDWVKMSDGSSYYAWFDGRIANSSDGWEPSIIEGNEVYCVWHM